MESKNAQSLIMSTQSKQAHIDQNLLMRSNFNRIHFTNANNYVCAYHMTHWQREGQPDEVGLVDVEWVA